MKLLHNAATFEVLNTDKELRDQMMRIEQAGRTCYQSIKAPITPKSAATFVDMIMKRGHLSVIEHSSMTVRFKNLSRGFTHELVRHRIASFSQESTRYVDYAKAGDDLINLDKFQVNIVAPNHKDPDESVPLESGEKLSFREMAEKIESFYRALRKAGWKPEDARQILPIGLKAEMIITANFREWHHIFKLRTSRYAHWEIRGVMIKLLKHVQPILSPIYDEFYVAAKDADGNEYVQSSLDDK